MKQIIETRKLDGNLNQVNDSRTIEGYALVFNSLSEDLGGFFEIIDSNALTDVIKRSDVFAYLNHQKDRGVLARSKFGDGTLTLSVDKTGLKYSFEAPATSLGDETIEHIRLKNITASSFAFSVKNDKVERLKDGTLRRTILEFDKLFDVSPVYQPAYINTSVDTRSIEEFRSMEVKKEVEPIEPVEDNKPIDEVEATEPVQEVEPAETTEPVEDCEPIEPAEEQQEVEEEQQEIEAEKNEPDAVDNEDELTKRYNSIIETAKEEKRKLTKSEIVESKEINQKLNQLNAVDENRNNKNNNTKKMKEIRFLDLLRSAAAKRSYTEDEVKFINAGKEQMRSAGIEVDENSFVLPLEKRAIQSATGLGLETVATTTMPVLQPLYNEAVLGQAGASLVTGVKNNLELPVYSGVSCGFASEIEAAADGGGTFSSVKFSPKRITCFVPVSKSLLAQDSAGVEAMILTDIYNKMNETLENQILGNSAGAEDSFAGLFAGVTGATTGVTYKNIADLEASLESKNVKNYKFIASPKAKAILKTTQKATNGKMIWEDGEVDGNIALWSNALPTGGLILGDFRDLQIVNFGDGIEISIDPYSLNKSNMLQIVAHFYVDAKVKRADSFVKVILA